MILYVCDGCEKQAPAEKAARGLIKPFGWYQRADEDGEQHACSRECIAKVSDSTGKTPLVLPI